MDDDTEWHGSVEASDEIQDARQVRDPAATGSTSGSASTGATLTALRLAGSEAEDDTITATYWIAEAALAELEETIDVLNRRAKRLGCEPVLLTRGAREERRRPLWSTFPHSQPADGGGEGSAGAPTRHRPVEIVEIFYQVTVSGAAPRLPGWEFVATLEHPLPESPTESTGSLGAGAGTGTGAGSTAGAEIATAETSGGTIVRQVPGRLREGEAAHYRQAPPRCEHCQVKRMRRDTYLVRSTSDGQLVQVGARCLRDFLGHTDPQRVAHLAELWSQIGAACHTAAAGRGGSGSRDYWQLPIDTYLTLVACAVRLHGWLSQSAARQRRDEHEGRTGVAAHVLSTAERVDLYLQHHCRHAAATCVDLDLHLEPTEADHALGTAALQYVRTEVAQIPVGDRQDYEHNLVAACAQHAIPWRQMGLAASAIALYLRKHPQRHLQFGAAHQEARPGGAEPGGAERTGQTGYVGTPDERLTLHVVVYAERVFPGTFGVRTLYCMRDGDGNTLVWWTSGRDKLVVDPERRVTIVATVKEHALYRDRPQTVLQRCRLVATDEANAPDVETTDVQTADASDGPVAAAGAGDTPVTHE